jgi:hypothetical protein
MIGFILAYRWRTTTTDARIPTFYQPPGAYAMDFSTFPGYGIRSLAELEVPISLAEDKIRGASATTLNDRDGDWAKMVNILTTRSDTFLVYGYIEAVRQNPRYVGSKPIVHLDGTQNVNFNNATDWYLNYPAFGAIPPAVSDDPSDSQSPMQRVGRRRWVALVDRSQANFSRYYPVPLIGNVLDPRFTGPRIVAQKDLPQ